MKFKILPILLLMLAISVNVFAQKPASVSVEKPITPIFVDQKENPVLKIEARTAQEGAKAESLKVQLDPSSLSSIYQVRLYSSGTENEFSTDYKLGEAEPSEKITFSFDKDLEQGRNYFWISVELSDSVTLTDQIKINSSTMNVGGELLKVESDRPNTPLKTAIKVREGGDDDVDTFRIPGIVTSNEGTLLAVYDVRYDNSSDLQGDIDVGLSRSTDGGETWEPMKIIMDMEEWGGLPRSQNGIGDPAIMVDRNTGTIWVSALWIHGYPDTHAWFSSQQGMKPEETGQFILVKSEDDGKTWSDPINITDQIKQPEWHLLLMGPGNGITMEDGTLVFAAQYKDENELPYSTIIYSIDHGETWEIGSPVRSNTTEAQVVELEEGRLMINMRDNRGGARSIYTTSDMGVTWTEHESSRTLLQEPVSMASLIKSNEPGQNYRHDYLLFSNPSSTAARVNMTLKLSKDYGESWPLENHFLLDEKQGFGYSSLTMVDEHTVGILYEGVRDLYFQKVPLYQLLDR